MRFSLIIPTYNRQTLLRRCLTAATAQRYPDYEVIVVDDGSPDKTGEMVRSDFPQVRYIRQEPNRGPAAARNRGIEIATGEIIAFTDDDCLIPVDFLARLAEGYQHCPEIAGAGGYLEAPDDILQQNVFAQYEAYVTHHIYHAGPEPYVGGFECPAGGTNSMSYRKRVLEEVGGFDETFPVPGGEDADLKWRVVQQGYRLLYVPIKVVHLHEYTLTRFWKQYHTHGRGAVFFERKHRGRPPSPGRLVLRAGMRCLRWIRELFTLGPRLASVKLVAELADVMGQWYEVRHWQKL